jgi:predicted site-specific integrase-resolvase
VSDEESNMTIELLPPVLIPAEVEEIFRITAQTRRRWEQEGRLKPVRLPSGTRRYKKEHILAILNTAN